MNRQQNSYWYTNSSLMRFWLRWAKEHEKLTSMQELFSNEMNHLQRAMVIKCLLKKLSRFTYETKHAVVFIENQGR